MSKKKALGGLESNVELRKIKEILPSIKIDVIRRMNKKNVKSGKGLLTLAGLLKLVNRFEETGKFEDPYKAGRPCYERSMFTLRVFIAVKMEAIASEAASGDQQCS
ncbi:hypothetical protein TNCV_172111 [Trichonephila clavipes]|nr:hypothetical protein TNCV_172111 [Trichonephila clavipes]